jgi:hypothetical protein
MEIVYREVCICSYVYYIYILLKQFFFLSLSGSKRDLITDFVQPPFFFLHSTKEISAWLLLFGGVLPFILLDHENAGDMISETSV